MNISAPILGRFGVGLASLVYLIIAFSNAPAQTRSFKWDTELCSVTGTYDAKKYSETQLRNTLSLFTFTDSEADVSMTVWKYEDIAKLDIAAYRRQYEQRSRRLRELDIVRSPYWESLRQERLKEMEQVYELTRTTAVAYTKPEVLKDFPRAETCKMKYARPLIAGGDSLVNAWREVNLSSQKVNADPKRLQDRFDRENASPDRLKFALVETMNFGWWNCAVALVERPQRANDGGADEEFRKLFKRVRQTCDEA